MKKLQNIPALIFTITFAVILIIRIIGKAETIDIVAYSLAVAGLFSMFIASNIKPKSKK